MKTDTADLRRSTDPAEPELSLEEVTAYEDGDAVVVCDRSNPRAWIRSDETRSLVR